ncbi:cytokinin dehydrogenase 3-like [Macadamia integrifolia]|uniref:cytokinin dehydrogenase 3-like n=1 Tax=Macadamia integrifolia TaxID=60698 RepID=UPI001C4FF30D|nr:cytokinin dehydrogenase 3-like [Macadamia integrifolia]
MHQTLLIFVPLLQLIKDTYIPFFKNPPLPFSSLSLSLSNMGIRSKSIKSCFIVILFVRRLMSMIEKLRKRPCLPPSLPEKLTSLDLAARLRVDSESITMASTDFGKRRRLIPAAVLYPLSEVDIVNLIRSSYGSSSPFSIAARGHGHSVCGQAMTQDGVVVDMRALNGLSGGRINLCGLASYVDVGGEQLWIEVLKATLEHGVAPRSWTDYLYLTVGGTLSNAGISGQSFRHGPQISNVYEMDVVTGRGEVVTCSRHLNSELFYAVLGGFGQFGIITRARIALEPAPSRVKWVRMLYLDFPTFTRDQEHLITINGDEAGKKGLDYVEGSLVMFQSPANNWRSSFFSQTDHSRITSLATQHGIIYCLEVAKYYDDLSVDTVEKELEMLLRDLSFIPGFIFTKDVSYVDFLDRVRSGELKLRSKGLWDIPHPWLNLFVPKSQIMDFDAGVFKGILQQSPNSSGPILVYPMIKSKWDDKMSAVTPDEDIFYSIGLLRSSSYNCKEDYGLQLENENRKILEFCEEAGINVKQYLPNYKTREEWMNHFGSKWEVFKERKNKFDPLAILSPGQRIFNFSQGQY